MAVPTKPVRILLVDDEEGIRMTVGANLELAGFEVVEAEDGARALEVLERDSRFDLVLTDIRMPVLSGVELFHRIRARFDVPVVLMTAFALENEIRDAIAHGAFAVLSKPFDVGSTVPTLRRASQKPFVLVVEGSEKDALQIADALSSAGVRARGVVSSEAALNALQEIPVDVCVADPEVHTPHGTSAVNRIRSHDPAIAIVVLADTVTPEVTAKLAAVRPAAFAENPIRPSDLVALVASVRGKARK